MRTSFIDWLWRVLTASQHPAQHLVIELHVNEGRMVGYLKERKKGKEFASAIMKIRRTAFILRRACYVVDCFVVAG